MRTVALLVFSFAFMCPAHASSQTSQAARRTLEDAVLLAGPIVAGLPIVLVAVLQTEHRAGSRRGRSVKTGWLNVSSSTAGATSFDAPATPLGRTINVS